MNTEGWANWRWSDGYLPEVRRILFDVLPVEIRTASPEMDMKRATDMIIRFPSRLDIAVRLRRPDVRFRDLTIRAKIRGGVKTELQKIREGAGDFYLYGWTRDMQIAEWIFVDLHKLRASGLLDGRDLIDNTDNRTSFIAITVAQLYDHECITNEQWEF